MRKILFADAHFFDEYLMLGQRQYALQFANHDWSTAYITNPLSPFNTIFGQNKGCMFGRLVNHFKNGTNIEKHLWYYVPFTFIPFHNHTIFEKKWFLDNYYKFTVPSIKDVIKKKGFSSIDVLWLGTCHQKFWKDILDYKCCIYRLADNFREFSKSSDVLLEAEEEVIQCSDIILVASKVLLKKYERKYNNSKFVYCPNGVDLSNFVRNRYNKPIEFRYITSPIALYVGAVGEWFDRELLINIAKQCPQITFVIIGVDSCGKMKDTSEKNIYYLGPRDYKDIPDYIYYCDCGIIPFNNIKLVQSVSPIKMYEFFILGKPVISREWEELRLLKSPCFLTNDASEFADILKDKNTFSIDPKRLVSYALENSWYKRYLKIVKILERFGI